MLKLKMQKPRGIALLMVILAILGISAFVAIMLKRSDILQTITRAESENKKLTIQAKEAFSNLRQAFLNEIDLWVRAKAAYDLVSATISDPEQRIIATMQALGIPPGQYLDFHSDIVTAAGGQFPSRTFRPRYPESGRSSLEISCLRNCNTGYGITTSYPKIFFVRLSLFGTSDSRDSVTIRSTLEAVPGSIEDYSSMAFGADSSQPEIVIGQGTYGKTGIFWSTDAVTELLGRSPPVHPTVRFMTPVGSTTVMESLRTNARLEDIQFGRPGTAIGNVDITDGVLSGQSPRRDLVENTDRLINDPATIRFASESICATRPITRSEFVIGCSTPTSCTYTIREWYRTTGGAEEACPSSLYSGNQFNPNAVIYSRSPLVQVRSSSSGADRIEFGQNNFTFIYEGKARLDASLIRKGSAGDVPGQQGNIIFMSRGDTAVELGTNFKTLSGPTLGEARQGSSIGDSTVSTRLELSAISMAQNSAAISLEDSLIAPSSTPIRYGVIEINGATWGWKSNNLRLLVGDEDTPRVGFHSVRMNFGESWKNPPRGMQVQTSSFHNLNTASYSLSTENLKQALADAGLTELAPPPRSAAPPPPPPPPPPAKQFTNPAFQPGPGKDLGPGTGWAEGGSLPVVGTVAPGGL